MGSLSSKNGDVNYLLCAVDVSTKYPSVKLWKGKKAKILLHGFIKIVNESNRKPNKLYVHQGKQLTINVLDS